MVSPSAHGSGLTRLHVFADRRDGRQAVVEEVVDQVYHLGAGGLDRLTVGVPGLDQPIAQSQQLLDDGGLTIIVERSNHLQYEFVGLLD